MNNEANTVTVTVNGRQISAAVGSVLSEVINGEKPCGGHGSCGKCKVTVKGKLSAPTENELKLLTDEELVGGARLSCMARVLGDCEISVSSRHSQIVTDGKLPKVALFPAFKSYGIAVDIGTTTLAARLYNTDGIALAEASRLNPQAAWGADVVSRIEAALSGKAQLLANAIRHELNGLITELADKVTISTQQIDALCITGNTVMLSLLTEQSVEPFSGAPFSAERLFGEILTAKELDLDVLSPDTQIYLPPCISAFVGADTVCAILTTELCGNDTAMLADIGTNGEMALWHNGTLTVCSTAAGPAFEGVGISMGMRSSDGAIDKVRIANGSLDIHILGEAPPKGICGSGLVDAVACMLELELLDESGYLEDEPFALCSPVTLTAKDIRMLQLAKSAICAGLLTLMREQRITDTEVSVLYVAGGFGNYLNKLSASRIGLLPRRLATRSVTVGNAALAGASVLLLSTPMRATAKKLAEQAVTLDLASSKSFADSFMSGMHFSNF